MRKVFFVLTFILGVCCVVQAGYVIRGIDTSLPPYYDLKNYTLTFNPDGVPISAASMYSISGFGVGKNTIVIIRSDTNVAYLFDIPSALGIINDVEVRDFHYDKNNEVYVLCGSRQLGLVTSAFVATIDHNFNMHFMEYPVADMFYSIGDPNTTTPVSGNYYVCGTRGNYGVIASVNRGTLQLTNFYRTNTAWEYHKIIVKQVAGGTLDTPVFVASGRNPECTRIGFTTLNALLVQVNNYMWAQTTDPLSHCVVSGDVSANNAVILASSYRNAVTMNPVTYPIVLTTVRAYRFTDPYPTIYYYVQDIGSIRINDATARISVAGFTTNIATAVNMVAWHGYVPTLPPTTPMRNNYYDDGLDFNFYEHYKIRHLQGNDYTGGSFRDANRMGALFATPLTASECDNIYPSSVPSLDNIPWSSFSLLPDNMPFLSYSEYGSVQGFMNFYKPCIPFKGGNSAPKSAMSAENESEITTFYDRIVVKDIPANTNYQIYNTLGQLISTGVTTPDISTASLGKGVYILRLESGKTFKFVK